MFQSITVFTNSVEFNRFLTKNFVVKLNIVPCEKNIDTHLKDY